MWLRFFIEDKVGVSIINIIPHCHTENASKRGKIKKCGFVSILRTELKYLSSIVCHTVRVKMF